MQHALRTALIVALLAGMVACAKPSQIPAQPDLRAGLSRSWTQMASSKTKVKEETSEAIRAEVLEAVQNYMMTVGRYPRLAVKTSELLSLSPATAPGGSTETRWSYRAIVRVDLRAAASQTIEFSVFERGGAIIVRKVSV